MPAGRKIHGGRLGVGIMATESSCMASARRPLAATQTCHFLAGPLPEVIRRRGLRQVGGAVRAVRH